MDCKRNPEWEQQNLHFYFLMAKSFMEKWLRKKWFLLSEACFQWSDFSQTKNMVINTPELLSLL